MAPYNRKTERTLFDKNKFKLAKEMLKNHSQRQTAEKLGVSESTLRYHLKKVST